MSNKISDEDMHDLCVRAGEIMDEEMKIIRAERDAELDEMEKDEPSYRPQQRERLRSTIDRSTWDTTALTNSSMSDEAGTKKSDGSTAKYYELPYRPRELQDIISADNMNGQIAEIFRACKRYGKVDHSSQLRDAKKMRFYSQAEIDRLEKYGDA